MRHMTATPTTATPTVLTEALRREGVTDARTDALTIGMYATDAGIYRVPPRAVVFPRHTDEIAATLSVARELGVPVTTRGAGTSCAGNAVGPGIVIDTARHLGRVLDVDRDSATAPSRPARSTRRCRPVPARSGCASVPTRAATAAAPSAG